jgi:hypothetical protein
VALEFPVGTDFPDNGDQIPDGHEYEGFYWDATDEVWRRKCDEVDLDDIYLKRHGDSVQDTDGNKRQYYWKDGVAFAPGDGTEPVVERTWLEVRNDSIQLRHGDGSIDLYARNDVVTFEGELGVQATSDNGDVLLRSRNQAEVVERTIDDTDVPKQITNKEYVDERDQLLQDQIVELEEEIEAIAPSVERGFWTMNLLGTVANQGQMSLYDDDYTNVGSPTGLFKDAKSIWLNEKDNAGTPHGFAGVKAGELIELFVQGANEYGLYEVVEAHDETNGATQWWVIEVNFVRTLEDTSTADNGDIIRVKIFNAPSGGSADEFVKKEGDEMTGELKFYSEQADATIDYNVPAAGAKDLRFVTKRLDADLLGTTSLYKPGYGNFLVCTGSLMSRVNFYTTNYVYGTTFNADGSRTTKNPSIYFDRRTDSNGDVTSEYGALRWHTTNILTWEDTKIEAKKPIVLDDAALPTADAHAVNKAYADTLLQVAGLQLGTFKYRRGGDSFVAGSIKSNTTTNPQNITQIDIYKSNVNGIFFGQPLYLAAIREKMWLTFRDKSSGHYVGRITGVEAITNGVRLTLSTNSGDTSGNVYYDNQYEVSIGYNRYSLLTS